MKQYSIYIFLIISVCIFASCVEPLDEAGIKEERIKKRSEEYRLKRNLQCKTEASEEAEFYVDSLIANWIGKEVMDTISFPNRPNRPSKPENIIGTVPKFSIEKNSDQNK